MEIGPIVRSMRRNKARYVLIAAEVAISVVLLVGAGLLLRSLQEIQKTQSG